MVMTHPEPLRRLAQLGDISQLAYVPADIDQAVRQWVALGAGPFFRIEHLTLDDVRYLGATADIDYSVLIGHWGAMQIELIEQHNDTPSIYTTWREAGHEGVHHVCIVVSDMAETLVIAADAGAVVVQQCNVPNGGEVVYLDTGGGPGTMIELFCPLPAAQGFFQMLRDAHSGWDGSDPVRLLQQAGVNE